MRRGTTLAVVLCLQVCVCLGAQSTEAGQEEARREVKEPAPQDSAGVESSRGEAEPSQPPPAAVTSAELAAYKSLWERLALEPEVRWLGSGSLGGVEGLALRGRAFRRAAVLTDGVPAAPDLNSLTPSLVDTVEILSLMQAQEEPFADGGEILLARSRNRRSREPVGLLFLGRGDFSSSFNAFTFGRSVKPWSFSVDLAGRSFGRAASYEGYSSDLVAMAGTYRASEEVDVTVQASKFRSGARRYTLDRTKTRVNSLALGAARKKRDGPSWRARSYYSSNRFTYTENGPELEDDIATYGMAVDFRPLGTEGGHRACVALRREVLKRSYKDLILPEGEIYPPPDDGRQPSNNVVGIYQADLLGLGRAAIKGLARIDRKELFGWTPSWSVALVGSSSVIGDFRLEGGRTVLAPGLLQIYSPRDEIPRPTWLMAAEMEAESGWEMSGTLRWAADNWVLSAGGYGASRKHVLAPSAGSLGFVRGSDPVLTSPLEDLGNGSSAGFRWCCAWRGSQGLGAGSSYSVQRTRAGGELVPFQPAHAAGLWIEGERRYFSDGLTVGVVLRGFYYSSQETPTHDHLPSYGVGEAMGYAAIADVVFFYQIKNLETRERPSPVLDLSTGEYLLQPGPEVRMGLVWYLPG